MKTALELLGELGRDREYSPLCDPDCTKGCALCRAYRRDLELVAQRAREEMREKVARWADDSGCDWAADEIRKLPVKP